MSERGVRKGDRFRWWLSDRSGFQFGFVPLTEYPNAYTREEGRPVNDKGLRVAPDEFDTPPPSTKPLGGEGEIGTGARANSNFAVDANVYTVPPESIPVVIYVNSSQTIAWNRQPTVYIAGSNVAQVMAVNPQLTPGTQGLYIALQCVGSSVTLLNGSGIVFDFSKRPNIVMGSGAIATIFFNATDSLWHMTSFNSNGGF